MRKGDGKNLATHRIIHHPLQQTPFAFLPPSSFGPQFRMGNSKTILKGSLKGTIQSSQLFRGSSVGLLAGSMSS